MHGHLELKLQADACAKGHSVMKKVAIRKGRNMSRNVSVNSGSLRFVQNISVGPHLFQADEPSENGGKDAGPEPHDLVLAALGAGAGIPVQMYADTKMGMVDGIEMGISFDGDLSEDQQRRMLEIAGKCPIHRLLTSPVPIQTKLLVPSSLPM